MLFYINIFRSRLNSEEKYNLFLRLYLTNPNLIGTKAYKTRCKNTGFRFYLRAVNKIRFLRTI